MKITVPFFKGEIPKLSGRLLPDGYATSAINARLVSGDLTAWKQPTTHALSPLLPSSALRSIYKMQTLNGGNDVFLRSVDDVDWAKGIIAADSTERIYFTGFRDDPSGAATPAVPKVTNNQTAAGRPGAFGTTIHTGQTSGNYPNNWLLMGVPSPSYADTAAEESKLSVTSVPTVADETLISDGTSTTPWTPTTNLTASSSGTQIVAGIKMTDPADTHTATDPEIGNANGDTIRFDFENDDDGRRFEFRFACNSLGEGPLIRFTTRLTMSGDGYFNYGTAPSWTGTLVNEYTSPTIPNLGPDQAYRVSITVSETAGVYTCSLVITRVILGDTIYTTDFIFVPQGTYLGFRTDPTTTGSDSWFDNVYYGNAADTSDAESTSYVYTWVNELGEESAPSISSDIVSKSDGLTTSISGIDDPTGADVTNYGLSSSGAGTKRLYRAATGPDGTTAYFFVADIPYGTTTYVDSIDSSALGELLESEEWDLPPTDGHSILSLPNGITVIASKNQVFPSETNRPHASLPDYALATDFDIVGLGAIDSTVVVLTKANPYLVVGSDPRQLSMAKLEVPQSCSSKRSIASVSGFGIVYATPDGLAAISGNGVQLISNKFFTREQWQALVPSSIYAEVHDDRYFFWYDTGSVKGGYIFDVKEGILTQLDLSGVSGFNNAITAGYSDPLTDIFYFIHSTNKLATWNTSGTSLQYTWKSKVYQFPYRVNLQAAQIKASSFGSGITFNVYGDGSQYYTRSVTTETEFVLGKIDHGANEVQIEVIGTATIKNIEAGETMQELF